MPILLAVVQLYSNSAHAVGMTDYRLEIAPGYQIIQANGFDIGLANADGDPIYSPIHGGKSGPITGYIVAPRHIFLRTTGQKERNHFPGDTLVEADPTIEYFFVLHRPVNELRGPLTLDEFNADRDVALLPNVNWVVPRNPHPGRLHWFFYVYVFAYLALPVILIVLGVLVTSKIIRALLVKGAAKQDEQG